MGSIGRKAIVESITFNIEFGGKKYVDVCVKYDKEDKITLGDIHHEDNDSWKLVRIGDSIYDFQIYGDDDSVIYKGGRKCLDNIIKSRLSVQLFEMYMFNGKLCHSSNILCNIGKSAKITNVRIKTDKGTKVHSVLVSV